MDFELKTLRPAQAAAAGADALVFLVFAPAPEKSPKKAAAKKAAASSKPSPEAISSSDDALTALAARAMQAGDFKPEAGSLLPCYGVQGVAAARVLLAGVGEGSARDVAQAVSKAVAQIKTGPAQNLTLCFAQTPSPAALQAAVLAAASAAYTYTHTKPGATASALTQVRVGLPAAPTAALKTAFAQAQGIAHGVRLAREWGNRPANHARPQDLAAAAQELARARGSRITCEVLGPKEVSKLGMGAFLSVARGSHEELRFITLRYQGAAKSAAPVALVGKGITFDTGGISIKPAAGMDEMKFDMCGAASVLGVFEALRHLQPAINVVGLIPACENMPGGSATKPGDVVTSLNGQTIEVLNTDAEGRLVLCDAIAYAEKFKPRAIIDIATLTGACVIALGHIRSGLYASDAALAQALQDAGEAAQDPCWPMPLDDDYAEGLKSNFADVANVAGREAGSVTAAKFLQRFVPEGVAWAHLDIAGSAWKSGAAKGATGRPVGLLVHYLLGQA